jgi:hypothetical protein
MVGPDYRGPPPAPQAALQLREAEAATSAAAGATA